MRAQPPCSCDGFFAVAVEIVTHCRPVQMFVLMVAKPHSYQPWSNLELPSSAEHREASRGQRRAGAGDCC